MELDKKTIGAAVAAAVAVLTGGAQVLSLSERVDALEALHPELAQEKVNETAEEMKQGKAEDGSQEPQSPSETEEPGDEPESAPEAAESPDAADIDGE